MRTLTTIALGLVLAMGAAGAFAQDTPHEGHGATSATPAPSGGDQHGSDAMKHSMMTGMDSMQKMSMSGDTDKDFAMMMKIHHQQALDMAKAELAHGKSPEMKAMAKQIIAAQKKEIGQFDEWLAKHK